MADTDLAAVLRDIRWADNADTFCKQPGAAKRVEKCLRRDAIWARQLEAADAENPALAFVHEARAQGHYVAALLGVALYKPAAASMRAMVESALYYSFFRSHPKELETLIRDTGYFLQKSDIIEFHKQHTDRFRELEQKLSLLQALDKWYKEVSGIVHGQIPGQWVTHSELRGLTHDSSNLEQALAMFETASMLIHKLWLVTVARDLWHDFAQEARPELLRGLDGSAKKALGLSNV
jgi:hypothetical protein